MPEQSSQSGKEWFGAMLSAGAVALLAIALVFANRSGQTPYALLGPLSGFVEWLASAGQGLATIDRVVPTLAPPLGAATLLMLGFWARRGRTSSATPIGAGLVFAGIGQLYLVDQNVWAGAAFYGLAIGAYAIRPNVDVEFSPLSSRATLVCVWLGLALFLMLGIHRLDVYPSFYFDEGAYLNAARMQVGSLEPGVVARYGSGTIYSFERFQFQRIPLWIQSAGLLALEPGLLALRLVSISAMLLAIAIAAVGLRRWVGSVPIVGMVAMAAASPLTLGYSRPGFYVSITVLHGVLCLLALLRLERRWDERSAAVLGLLLGTSLYCYQLSWFVPVLALVVLAATPGLWRRPKLSRICAIAAAAAGIAALPGLLGMPDGFRSVTDQTFDKASWNSTGGAPLGVVVAPAGVADVGAEQFAVLHRSADLTALRSSTGERPVVVFYGAEPEVDRAVAAAEAAGWYSLGGEVTRSAIVRVSSIAKRLFYLPGWESGGRWIDGALLNPWVAPLLILGLVEVVRRRSVFAFRLLGVWVVVGALLPASIGGGFPRRTVLILPVVFAVASLPLAVWIRTASTTRTRALASGLSVLWLLGGTAFGTHHYLDHWDQRISLGPSYPVLAFDKALHALPDDQRVFAPRILGRDWRYLHPSDSERAKQVTLVRDTEEFTSVRSRSCVARPPFAWVVPDEPEMRDRFARLSEDFVLDEQRVGPYLLIRVESQLPDRCQL